MKVKYRTKLNYVTKNRSNQVYNIQNMMWLLKKNKTGMFLN